MFRDPRDSPERALAIFEFFDESDGVVPWASGGYLRARALAAGMRAVLPTDVVALSDLRRSLGCTAQCHRCSTAVRTDLGDRVVAAPYRWLYCLRTADALVELAGRHPYRVVLVSDMQLHPYVPVLRTRCRAPLVVDLHNAEADLYESMVTHPEWPWPEPRGTHLPGVAAVERGLLDMADVVTVPSTSDRDALLRWHGADTPVHVLPNAVHVDPGMMPAPRQPSRCVFVGQLGYFPNTLAGLAIARSIGPAIRETDPRLPIVVAGRTPPPNLVEAIGRSPATLVADPPDIDPILDGAILIVPLTFGGGTRLKILQAFALGTPVISTDKGIQGIDATPHVHYRPADTPTEFADAVHRTRHDLPHTHRQVRHAWQLTRDRYSWAALEEPVRAALAAARGSVVG